MRGTGGLGAHRARREWRVVVPAESHGATCACGLASNDWVSTNSPSLRHSSLSTFSTGIRHGRRTSLPPLRGSRRRRVDRWLRRVADARVRRRCRRGYAGLRELLADARPSCRSEARAFRRARDRLDSAQQGVNLVRVQFDVPEGMTLVLREQAVGVDARDGGVPRRATIPHINPAAPARYPQNAGDSRTGAAGRHAAARGPNTCRHPEL
jgi:hypothetical protein